jgi:protein-S-isoprenylcysteine O-methyltransferase Ste14
MQRLFKAVYFAGMIAEIVIRTPYERQRNQISKTDQRVSRTERTLLAGLAISFVLPVVYSLTSWLDFANYRLSLRAKTRVGGAGVMLMAATLLLFWRSHRDLGTNWSPTLEIGEQHALVTGGVYRMIRHPMYASGWLWAVSQALLLHNWIAGLSGLVAFVPLYFIRVPREERMMLDHFGAAYRAYSARTGRIMPRLGR